MIDTRAAPCARLGGRLAGRLSGLVRAVAVRLAIIVASSRPIWPKPSSTASVCSALRGAAADLRQLKAAWIAAARGRVLGRDDERDVELRGACAMATMLIPPATARRTRARRCRVPRHAMPTTASVASPVWISMPSISLRAISSRKTASSRSRARLPRPRDAEADRLLRRRLRDERHRRPLVEQRREGARRDAGHPSMPLPVT